MAPPPRCAHGFPRKRCPHGCATAKVITPPGFSGENVANETASGGTSETKPPATSEAKPTTAPPTPPQAPFGVPPGGGAEQEVPPPSFSEPDPSLQAVEPRSVIAPGPVADASIPGVAVTEIRSPSPMEVAIATMRPSEELTLTPVVSSAAVWLELPSNHARDCRFTRWKALGKVSDREACTCFAARAFGLASKQSGIVCLRDPLPVRPGKRADGTGISDTRSPYESSSLWACLTCGYQGYSDDRPAHSCDPQQMMAKAKGGTLAEEFNLAAEERLSPRYRLSVHREPTDGLYMLQEEYDAPDGARHVRQLIDRYEAWDVVESLLLSQVVERMSP